MTWKGRRRLRGRAYDYAPVLTREKAASNAIGDMIERLFGGSVDGLLMSLVKSEQLDPKKLQELSGLVEEHERGKEEKSNEPDLYDPTAADNFRRFALAHNAHIQPFQRPFSD
jgi:hypothetical protein